MQWPVHKSPSMSRDRAIDFRVATVLVPRSVHGAQPGGQRWAPHRGSSAFSGLWRYRRCKAMTFSGLGAVLLGFGSTRSLTSEPVCTGTPPAANLLCQPHACCLDVFPIVVVFSFLALLEGSCPAQHPWHLSCPHPGPSSCLGPISWEGWSRCEWSQQQV